MYDLIVLGGGLTGCAAEVAAARRGLSVLLIEKTGALGGAPVNSLINPFMPNGTRLNGAYTELSQGMYTELKGRLAELQVCCCCMLVVLSAANGLHVCCHVFTPSIQLLITAPHTISPASEPAGGR